ncbi:MAG: SPOR domain-containing protein [Thiomicrorhabdus sp.]|nr:SPOR domain-containing protein [Thiomicrorhabdus sp.]MCF6298445.1 SPOR domain-containing protein [Thiomicrorhabdus sp.]
MDEVSKYRLTGAVIWLMLLVFLVPVWFGEPVHFKPEGYIPPEKTVERPMVQPVMASLEGKSLPVVGGVEQANLVKESKKELAEATQIAQKQWIVRIIAYKNIQDANALLGRLEVDYDVMIKTFEKSGMHSVRVGPYFSKVKAEQAKQKLDKMLHTQAEVVQLK